MGDRPSREANPVISDSQAEATMIPEPCLSSRPAARGSPRPRPGRPALREEAYREAAASSAGPPGSLIPSEQGCGDRDRDRDKHKRDREQGQHGCEHYRRRCKLVAPCCDSVFWCRHCHNTERQTNEADSRKRHELDRTTVRELVCAICSLRQPTAASCTCCGVSFGSYTCMTCCFFDDELGKEQFHCDSCGICRVGGRDKFFHCNTCGCCYSKSLQGNHHCVEGSMRQNCPVCFEYLFDSVQPTAVLPCGHTIHSECLKDMERNHQMTCPICMKSYADLRRLWQRLDNEIALTPMPQEYASWRVDILCNDCNRPSQVNFHVLGLKCSLCSSYNTRRIAMDRGSGMQPLADNEVA